MPKTWYKIVLIILGIILGIFLLGFGVLIFSEYFPEDVEQLEIDGQSSKSLKRGESFAVYTYNLGYLSLDNTQDFFMDGGKGVRPNNASVVNKNKAAIQNFIETRNGDIYLFQEVDKKAKRSYNVNEYNELKSVFDGTASYAPMFNSLYIPYPIFDTVGHVESGVVTFNKYNVKASERIALPSAIGWPKRAVMYKNCLLKQTVDVEDSDKDFIVYNLHLDAYGKDSGTSTQLQILIDDMKAEYEKGNYCLAGGDFNQILPGVDLNKFPIMETENYNPTQISADAIPEGWQWCVDKDAPTTRLLNEVYSGNYDNTQMYVIDGYIASPNITVNGVDTKENNFSYSDHHPVGLSIKLN